MSARLLNLTMDEYIAHPGFNSTTAKVVIERSPLHAKVAMSRAPSKAMDRGQIVHRLVLGSGADFEVLHYENFKTKAAQTDRDKARDAGRVPILEDDFAEANMAAESIRVELAERGIVLDGVSEQAIEWTEHTDHGELLCKGRFDHAWLVAGGILDLKVTEDASQNSIERTAENLWYGVQSAAYTRALLALDPGLAGRARFLFAFAEGSPPFAMNLVEPSGSFRELGERRWLRAVNTWARCKAEDHWPAYGININTISPPGWALAREGFSSDEF